MTNSIYSSTGKILAYHTWHARSYGSSKKHTDRINKILLSFPIEENSDEVNPVIFKDRLFSSKQKIKKIIRLIKLKLGMK